MIEYIRYRPTDNKRLGVNMEDGEALIQQAIAADSGDDAALQRPESPLQNARRRLAEERASRCSSPGDVAFWRYEIMRFEREEATRG